MHQPDADSDDELTTDVLAALADDEDVERCQECDEMGTDNGYYCEPCLTRLSAENATICPFCLQFPREACPHLVLGQDGEGNWVTAPAGAHELPPLPTSGDVNGGWAEDEREVVFAEFAPLLDTYESPDTEPNVCDFYVSLGSLMSTPVVVLEGFDAVAVYSERHRDEARAEIDAIIRRLADGFERLEAQRRAGLGEQNDA